MTEKLDQYYYILAVKWVSSASVCNIHVVVKKNWQGKHHFFFAYIFREDHNLYCTKDVLAQPS